MSGTSAQLAALLRQLQAQQPDPRLTTLNRIRPQQVGVSGGAMMQRGVEPPNVEEQELQDRGWHAYMASKRTGDKAVDPNMQSKYPAQGDQKLEIAKGKYSLLGGMLDFDHDPMNVSDQHLIGATNTQAPAYDQEKGYEGQYNTKLTPDEESKYQAWGAAEAKKRPDGRNPANDTYDYDMRGFWKAGNGAPNFADNGHAGDAFKKPNHPTFSSLSQYSNPEMPGGQWRQLGDGSWTFTPTPHNLKFNDAGDLQQYFGTVEKGNKLILPGQAADAPSNQPATQKPAISAPLPAVPAVKPATPAATP